MISQTLEYLTIPIIVVLFIQNIQKYISQFPLTEYKKMHIQNAFDTINVTAQTGHLNISTEEL